MASESEIKIHFQQAVRQAEELEETAGELRKLAREELGQALQNLSGVWKGEAADSYLNRGTRLETKMEKSAKDLEVTAAVIRSTAKRIYDAEMQAYRLAKERTYEK